MSIWPWVLLTGAALAGVLICEGIGCQRGRWLLKPIASAGFLAVAIASGALETLYGRAVLVGLGWSWVGDVALLGRGSASMRVGIATFALAHVAYGVAFCTGTVGWVGLVGSAPVLLLLGVWIASRLWPRVPRPLRGGVVVYLFVISSMVILATGSVAGGHSSLRLLAALLFYVSDVSVACDRFLEAGFMNRLWGLPAYYAAQLIFAAGV